MKKEAIQRVRTILEERFVPLRSGRARKDVVAFVEIDGCTSYIRLKNDKWTSTAGWTGHKVDHFSMANHEGGRSYASDRRRYRGDSRKAVRGLIALGLVSAADGEIARLHFHDLMREEHKIEGLKDLKRDAKRLGVKLVFPKKHLSKR